MRQSCPAVLLAFFLATAVAADEPSPTAFDEQTLKEAHVGTDGPGLIDFFRKHTINQTDHERVAALVRLLGDPLFERRQAASAELVTRGPVVMKQLQDALQSSDAEVVHRADECLRLLERSSEPAVLAAAARLLAARKPAGAAEALLGYLPCANDEMVIEEVRSALTAVTLRDGRPEQVVLDAVADKAPVRRAAAGEALVRAGPADGRPALRKLMRDPDATVRLWTALAFVDVKEREAVPTLIGLLGELPREQAWRAEDVLCRIAGEKVPGVALGNDDAERRKCRDAWARWWEDNQAAIDLAKLDLANRQLGYTLVVELDLRGTLNGKVREVGLDGKTRWQIEGLKYAMDAQITGPDRVLITEYTGHLVSERNFKGDILWKKELEANCLPVSAQRLPNGTTFITCRNALLEVDRAGKELLRIDRGAFDIMSAQKLRNGQILVMTNRGALQRLDAAGKELRSIVVDPVQVFGGGIDALPNGHVLVPQYQQGKVVEYDAEGKVVWQVSVATPTYACRIAKGHTLVVSLGNQRIVELDQSGKEVWQYHEGEGRPMRARRR